ncbi:MULTISPECIES: urease accessory protein [Hymenobacter]|uniref:urease accessory protein n=1 Tax=Hymenobacter TaxID=89966 RepID=UPI0010586B1F|nr:MULTISPECIES: urease accessory protein [Hymenobacter]QIL78270.1 urease accessory protein [Hymenobacter sp. HDW8]
MEGLLPLIFASVAGMGHAFEPDHILAVGNLISRRDTLAEALREGILWGLGHTTTLVVVGAIILLGRLTILTGGYFEATVGLLLVLMGLSRLREQRKPAPRPPTAAAPGWAFAVGLLHGLAGSGALVLLVMSELRDVSLSLLYFLLFGGGSLVGMCLVAGLCHVPFTRRMRLSRRLQAGTVTLSSLLCVGYGSWMMYVNL